MTAEKLSINKVCVLMGSILTVISTGMVFLIYFLTESRTAMFSVLVYLAVVLLGTFGFLLFVRRKLTLFSDLLCRVLDSMMSSDEELLQPVDDESLFYKVHHRLDRLYEVLKESKNSVAKERADLKELISDISHQVKTPVANLKMLDATLLEQSVPPEKQKEFLLAMESQLDKLDFLMQAMVKTSRLETGMISLEKRIQPVYDTLASALGGILLNAEKKQITVTVNCPETLAVSHDRKWTGEALFNILDNAVKYTPVGGKIGVTVSCLEMYVKIAVADTGRGIPEQHQGTIFKRFYREEDVHDVEGIGIGLYLAREIITMQGGYIRVDSEIGCGSTFSVFLLR